MKMNLPWVESPFFEKILPEKKLSKEQVGMAQIYNKDGYIVLKNVFTEEEINQVIKEMHEKGFNPDYTLIKTRDANRCQDLWENSDPVKNLAIKPEILSTLEMLYDREVVPFQTLNFLCGTQQMAHSDTIHFSSMPAKFMAGVWIALEDVTHENGPLFYYPGSHQMPEYNFNHFREDLVDNSYANYHDYELFMEALMLNSPYEKKEFLAKKGDVLIWSANIVHGGSPVIDPNSTRLSQVTHYYFKDCIYYSPMSSNTISGELQVRTNLKNMRTGLVEPSSFNGQATTLVRTHKSLYTINAHLVYPSPFRHLSDFWYVFKMNGLKGLLNDLFIKLRVILFKLGLRKSI
jgi:ectoine hydroxylase-related dioxygenase (phytanoyl-CoA dioxygenase family)